MKKIEEYPALAYVVGTLAKAIAGSKVEQKSASEYIVRDGNDEILLKQESGINGSSNAILITDSRSIIFSEDLLEPLQNIHETVKGDDVLKNALKDSTIIINGLDIETDFVFQAVKDFLDQVSNSYEFVQTVETNITKIGAGFKFGKHIFRLNITNEAEKVLLEPRFVASFDKNIQKTITEDMIKVQLAVNKMFKTA
ncbi:hypothetical protein EZ428_15235 [Pedobacter frigiditerrae]|uniref:Uncharacterized protein n=1 Tax=Pedobacter frigiditerrae TaxID=2530452 RepID=A0A4R0MR48_9SPHI|nr:hypothetical protein [Pedobacter frigiditerrae]TCC89057.1 hypothetical protein EZ428_15235 [Pedobacter frigiditerrae]